MQLITVLLLSFLQSVTFTMSSRARNRSNYKFNLACTVVSSSVWFLTLREILLDPTLGLLIPYVLGAGIGTLIGTKVSMLIEHKIGAKADEE
jgi:multidrug transporter EmrE-like cation transporter